MLGLEKQHSIAPFRADLKFRDFLPAALLQSVAMRQNLQITAKNCRLKIHKKNVKDRSLIDIKPRQAQNSYARVVAPFAGSTAQR